MTGNICIFTGNNSLAGWYSVCVCVGAVVSLIVNTLVMCVFVRSQVRMCWRVFEVWERQASG